MGKFEGLHAIVTGASSGTVIVTITPIDSYILGLGYQAALQLAAEGAHVVLGTSTFFAQ